MWLGWHRETDKFYLQWIPTFADIVLSPPVSLVRSNCIVITTICLTFTAHVIESRELVVYSHCVRHGECRYSGTRTARSFVNSLVNISAYRQKTDTKIFSWTQYEISTVKCNWYILAGNEARVISYSLNWQVDICSKIAKITIRTGSYLSKWANIK